jgi:MoaA/NifB/PqqE/SkfB family radical SAM enzyme
VNAITDLPWSVQPEVVEGCNFRCWFCGIRAIRGRDNDLRFMELDLLEELFRQFNAWRPKIRAEYNNHGEPTLHPKWWEIVECTRKEAPQAQIQLQTNGYLFFPKSIQQPTSDHADFNASVAEFFSRGGNLLALNCYKRGTYDYALDMAKSYLSRHHGAFQLVDFYHNNPHNVGAYTYHGTNKRILFIFDDLGVMNVSGTARRRAAKWIDNEAGNVSADILKTKLGREPLVEPLRRGCTRPFREIVVSYDGHVPICCYDWRSQQILGKFPNQSLREIWFGKPFVAARVLLDPKNSERNMPPCNVCDLKGGFRMGLIHRPNTNMTVTAAYRILEASNRVFQSRKSRERV